MIYATRETDTTAEQADVYHEMTEEFVRDRLIMTVNKRSVHGLCLLYA